MIAGAMLKYDQRKDKWTRVFGAIFGSDLYLFHTKPTPRSYRGADSSDYGSSYVASVDRPKWLGQGGAVGRHGVASSWGPWGEDVTLWEAGP